MEAETRQVDIKLIGASVNVGLALIVPRIQSIDHANGIGGKKC